ncbi:MAG: hypothetical protein AAGA58_05285 [Verrucomicrobiota bacterium]
MKTLVLWLSVPVVALSVGWWSGSQFRERASPAPHPAASSPAERLSTLTNSSKQSALHGSFTAQVAALALECRSARDVQELRALKKRPSGLPPELQDLLVGVFLDGHVGDIGLEEAVAIFNDSMEALTRGERNLEMLQMALLRIADLDPQRAVTLSLEHANEEYPFRHLARELFDHLVDKDVAMAAELALSASPVPEWWRWDTQRTAMDALARENPETALALLESHQLQNDGTLLAAVLEGWVTADAEMAIQRAKEMSISHPKGWDVLSATLQKWAESEPLAAMEEARDTGRENIWRLTDWRAGQAMRKDPEKALEWLRANPERNQFASGLLPYSEDTNVSLELRLEIASYVEPETIGSRNLLPEKKLNDEQWESVVDWVGDNPESGWYAISRLLHRAGKENPEIIPRLAAAAKEHREFNDYLANNSFPLEVTETILAHLPPGTLKDLWTAEAREATVKKDGDMSSFGDSPGELKHAASHIANLTMNDPQSAVEMVAGMPEGKARATAASNLAYHWAAYDPEASWNWMEENLSGQAFGESAQRWVFARLQHAHPLTADELNAITESGWKNAEQAVENLAEQSLLQLDDTEAAHALLDNLHDLPAKTIERWREALKARDE